ncbi:YbbD family protein [Pragia fontium]|uniref:YbbD head domain-containing protein n=1 Tax=Pragia fontium DSM 5563 = ATCC 49100 TaxID=1122977 RepID=A0AAJ4WCD1_9GAMM|nr:hypothetical protein [Pragia fontium]SFD17870.1 hypothetical protein SAMN02745723_10981 [Pragia fontium DSM 5563 = ATCC 49100]VEJ52903.1 Uncharacterised protein [Pragia fontium]
MIKWLFFSMSIMLLSGCDNTEKVYSSFSEILPEDSIRSWLPDFFPKSSTDIIFASNIDLNTFHIYFSSTDQSMIELHKVSKETVISEDGILFLKQQDGNIVSAVCMMTDHNLFGDKSLEYYLMGKLNSKDRYYLMNINIKQYERFC